MMIHFFTAPSFCPFSLLVVKNKRKRAYFPLPQKISFLKLSCHIHMCLLLPMVFVQVEANRNQKNFHFH